MTTSNPYEAPKTVPARGGGLSWGLVQVGLIVYALGAVASVPFAIAAAEASERLFTFGGEVAFQASAGWFYLARAIGDVGGVLAFVAGLVWLHQAWRDAESRGKAMSTRARNVVGWVLVPVWGLWKLHGFLLELARRRRIRGAEGVVQRWWWVLVAHGVVRLTLSTNHVPGWAHVADSMLYVVAAALGMQMLWKLQRDPASAT